MVPERVRPVLKISFSTEVVPLEGTPTLSISNSYEVVPLEGTLTLRISNFHEMVCSCSDNDPNSVHSLAILRSGSLKIYPFPVDFELPRVLSGAFLSISELLKSSFYDDLEHF